MGVDRSCRASRAGLGWVAAVFFTLLIPALAQAKPTLLASIKPLALIAQEVAGDHAEVNTLLPITASPHDYPLKMSDHRQLHNADLVLWVGPELESFLARSLANRPAGKIVSAYSLPDIHWPTHSGAHDHEHVDHHHKGGDPHLWLDPHNARVIALAVAEKLALLDPASANAYRANAASFVASAKQLDKRLHTLLAPVKAQGFAVYHEGYSHFVSRYDLHQVGYVTYAPERRPGAKHLKELQEVLRREGKCLFVEPYYDVSSIEEMARSLGLKIGVLDPIGDQQISSYQTLMEKLGNSFLTCLTNAVSR